MSKVKTDIELMRDLYKKKISLIYEIDQNKIQTEKKR